MKYLEVTITILAISLALNLIVTTGIFPVTDDLEQKISTGTIDRTDYEGEYYTNQSAFANNIEDWSDGKYYLNALAGSETAQYLAGGGDFIRALLYFYDVFVKGTVLVAPMLANLFVPPWIRYIIIAPIWFMYAVALIQIISKNGFGGST